MIEEEKRKRDRKTAAVSIRLGQLIRLIVYFIYFPIG